MGYVLVSSVGKHAGMCLVCQIARRANQRLTPLRQRVQRQRHQAILEEVRKEIQQKTAARTSHAWPTATGSASSTGVLAVEMQSAQDERNSAKSSQDGQAAARVYTYTCPSCQQCVQSSVFTGKVNTRGHCGRQFRVAAGRVCTRYTHACPTCNTKVESKQPHGRIRAQHTNTRGRTCKTTEWLVAAPNEPCRSSRKVAVGSQRRFRSPGATAYRRFLSPLEK